MGTVPDITCNCVTVVYSDGTYRTRAWDKLDELKSEQTFLAIRVFHAQDPDPTQPAFETSYNPGEGLLCIHQNILPTGDEDIMVDEIQDAGFTGFAGNQLAERRTFKKDASQQQVFLKKESRYARTGDSKVTIESASFNDTDWLTRSQAAIDSVDVGPCPSEGDLGI